MIITSLNETSDLIAVRNAIPGANVIITPLLYDRMHLSFSEKSLQNAEQILIHHPRHVRTIHIFPCVNEVITRKEFRRRVAVISEGEGVPEWKKHLRKAYTNYVNETNGMTRILQSRDLGALLGRSMRELPNLRRVVFDAAHKPKYRLARLKEVGDPPKSLVA